MNLMSESYKQQNQQLHEGGSYGIRGHLAAERVFQLADLYKTRDILDYGCGQRTLQAALGFDIRNYDPCIAGLDTEPEPADLVVCGDVLEHVEPEYLDNVLDDLQRVTRHIGYFIIANKPAGKTLPDGRNAHLIQEGNDWWMPRLMARFTLRAYWERKTDMHYLVEKK